MSSLRNRRAVLALALLSVLLPGASAWAQQQDTLGRSVITERMVKPMVLNQKGISGSVNTEKISAVPSFLGNADPIRFVRLLPSVQMNTEVEGGLYMQGSDHSHTLISQSGVPIYGVSHLMGMFSVFNTPHYKGIQYSTTARQESRMGGIVDMELQDTVSRRFSADFSLGLLSAQGTLDIPMGASSLKVSARRTYINVLYGNFLQFAGFPIRYGFTDANVTWTWKPGKKDRIWADLFGCLDQGRLSGTTIRKMDAQWYNALGALHWNHYFPEASMKQTVYGTTYGVNSEIEAFQIKGWMPAYIRDYGYRNTLQWKDWEFGLHYSFYDIQPQNPRSEGHMNDSALTGGVPRQQAMEAVLSAQYSRILGYWLQLKAGMGVNWYLSPERKSFWGATPEVELLADFQDYGKVTLRYGLKRQNLFQLGITNKGFPIEFWVAAGDIQAPQWSHNFSLAYNASFLDNAWSVSAELYYKLLYNQLDYVGDILDIYNGQYSLENSVLQGKGRAYGVNLMLQRNVGPLTGWLSYSYAPSLRTFDAMDEFRDGAEYSSSHERLHELDVVATYDFGKWDVGGSLVVASGLPYTRPEAFYVVGSRVICNYGTYNGERLPTYARLDVSANWFLRKDARGKTGFNFSIYNVLGIKNAVSYGIHMNDEMNAYSFRPMDMVVSILPSIAFFHSF